MAGKWFFRCPDEIWTPGLMPLPFPRFFEKNRVKLFILRTFLCHFSAGADSYISAKLIFRQAAPPSLRELSSQMTEGGGITAAAGYRSGILAAKWAQNPHILPIQI